MAAPARASQRVPASERFSDRVAVLGVVFAVGIHIDGWAHNHGRVDDSFFTPWHAVLYGTYALVVYVVLRRVLDTRAAGAAWRDAVPEGYALTVIGIGVFFAGGFADMLWHTVFGVEENLEALVSPTHLVLATGAVMMATGPFLAGTRQPVAGWRQSAPAVLTALAFLSFVGFMTQYMNPLSQLWPVAGWWGRGEVIDELSQAVGVAGFIWHAATLSAVVLVLRRLGSLPTGAAGALITGSAAFAVTQGDDYWLVIPAAIGGLLVELAMRRLPGGRFGLRMMAFLVPAIPVTLHMAALPLVHEIGWPVALWAGVPPMAGMVGVIASLAVYPPGAPTPEA